MFLLKQFCSCVLIYKQVTMEWFGFAWYCCYIGKGMLPMGLDVIIITTYLLLRSNLQIPKIHSHFTAFTRIQFSKGHRNNHLFIKFKYLLKLINNSRGHIFISPRGEGEGGGRRDKGEGRQSVEGEGEGEVARRGRDMREKGEGEQKEATS